MPGWFDEQGIAYAPDTGGEGQPMAGQPGFAGPSPAGAPGQGAEMAGMGGFQQPQGPGPMAGMQPQQTGQVGHDGSFNGQNREQWRDAWMSSGEHSVDSMKAWMAQNGGTLQSDNGTFMTPFGESMDLGFNARGAAAGNGKIKPIWGGGGGGGDAQATTMGPGAGGLGGLGGGGGYGGGGGAGGGSGGWDGTKFTSTDIARPDAYTPQAFQAQQAGQGANVSAGQIQGPDALAARQLGDPSALKNLTNDELKQTDAYKFRLSQGLGAMQNAAASKGTLFGGATLKGLNDYAGQSASQEYEAANQRAQQVAQGNITNQANTVGQNNQANAQAYGLTNQYQQGAQIANQGANLQAGMFNSGQQQQNNQFNAGQGNQAGMFNAGRTDQANQQNFQNRFAVEQANEGNRMAAWQGNTNAQLGQGNLANQQASTANQFSLGLGNLALGNRQADQSFALGMGNLGVSQGYLGQAGQAQQFSQAGQTFDRNYGVYRDNRDTQFNQNFALTQLGQNSAGNYGNQAGNYYTNQGQGNAGAAIAQGNALAGGLGTLGNLAGQGLQYWSGGQQGPAGPPPTPYGYG